ncbi:hypothetical protein JNUCC64_13635 [Streptomyces sp. JNUCC 64]
MRNSTVRRSLRRRRLAVAVAALATMTLAACGTGTDAKGAPDRSAATGGTDGGVVRAAATAPEPGTVPDEEVGFLFLLERVGRPCAPDPEPHLESGPGAAEPDGEGRRGGPATPKGEGPLPVPADPPADKPAKPGPHTPYEERKLNRAERCEGRLHAERITRVLDALDDPTPARVGKALDELGYPDGRVHGLKRSGGPDALDPPGAPGGSGRPGGPVRFFLDLRMMGGSLALEGTVSDGKTAVEPFAVAEVGPFAPEDREDREARER